MGVELFHADRQTDTTKLVVAFRNFANAPKKLNIVLQFHFSVSIYWLLKHSGVLNPEYFSVSFNDVLNC